MTYEQRKIALLTSALEQANDTTRSKMDELSMVRRVGDAISQHSSIWSLSSELVDAIAEAISCKYALIYASSTGPLELQAVSTIFSDVEHFPVTMGQGQFVRYLTQTGSSIVIRDISDDPIWAKEWPFPKNLASWLCVPLLTHNHLRGILCLADDLPGAFDERTLRTLMVVVPQISNAFSNIDLYDHLRQSEKKYRTLVTGIQDVVYICDRQWVIVDANPAAEALFKAHIVGKTLTELFALPNAASSFVEAVRKARAVQNFETELLTGTNERMVCLLSCVTEDGQYSGIIKDMTERTQLVEQITRAQKMESIGTLASGVAHDFNNILGIILPNAELIKMRIGAESPANRYADVIINSSQRAAQVTKQLLSLARRDPAASRVLSLSQAVRSTGKLLSETLNRNIRLEFDLSEDCTNIKADETQLEQVFLNLAINARDAMPEGGILKFVTRLDGDRVVARVIDSGAGIPREILAKIFDPFFTTKDKSKGTGLGLSVVYGLVKHTGGTVDVKSELGIGTEFILSFPSCQEKRRAAIQKSVKAAGGAEKILIADDEPEILNLLETVLSDLGYSVISASNGIEAVDRATDDVRLVILDMMMPEMDGVTALRLIRQKMPDVRVLVCSGYTSPEKTPIIEALGIDGFIRKPFEVLKLAATVRDVLDGVTA